MTTKNLVLVCTDETDTDNPEKWISEKTEYELVFLCYSLDEKFARRLANTGKDCYMVRSGKWKNIRAYFYEIGFGGYDYFWFPDPDLLIDVKSINALFKIAREYQLSLCQPAVTRDSYEHWVFLKQQVGGSLREVPMVEIMCPCFCVMALKQVLWTFDLSYSGYGLDFLWAQWLQGYVIDAIAVRHPRPANFHMRAKEKGFPDPTTELNAIKRLMKQ